jgi:hypothetical protein
MKITIEISTVQVKGIKAYLRTVNKVNGREFTKVTDAEVHSFINEIVDDGLENGRAWGHINEERNR